MAAAIITLVQVTKIKDGRDMTCKSPTSTLNPHLPNFPPLPPNQTTT